MSCYCLGNLDPAGSSLVLRKLVLQLLFLGHIFGFSYLLFFEGGAPEKLDDNALQSSQ